MEKIDVDLTWKCKSEMHPSGVPLRNSYAISGPLRRSRQADTIIYLALSFSCKANTLRMSWEMSYSGGGDYRIKVIIELMWLSRVFFWSPIKLIRIIYLDSWEGKMHKSDIKQTRNVRSAPKFSNSSSIRLIGFEGPGLELCNVRGQKKQ